MRIVRILLSGLLILLVIAAAVVALVFHNEEGLVRILLQRIDASTGYNVVPSAVRVRFRDHLRVTLEQPRVYQGGVEIARLDDILAVVSYHLIFKNKGLPLRELRLDRPVGRVPAAAASDVGYAIPRPDVAGVQSLLGVLNAVGDFSSQIDLYDATLMDPGGQTIVEHFDFLAKREHRRVPHSPWLVSFDGAWRYPPMGAFRLSGNAHLGTAKQALTGVLWSSDSWFWDLHMANVASIQGVTATGTMQGKLHLVLNQNGTLEGHALADLADGVLNGPAFTQPLGLGSFSMTADYDISEALFNLAKVEITRNQALLVAGSCAITNPYDPARKVALRISGIKVALARVASDLQSIRATPPALIDLAKRVSAGHLEIEQALISPAVPFKDWGVTTIRDNLKLGAIVKGVGFDLKSPQEPNLPSVSHLEAGMIYDKGLVQITQGSAAFGQSSLSGINGQTRITHAPRVLPYSLRFKSQLNFDELYPLATPFISKLAPHEADHIQNVQGNGALRVQASGSLQNLAWSPPHDYVAVLSPNQIQAAVKGIPQHLTLVSGDITASPGQVHVDHLVMAPAHPNSGSVTVNGTILTDFSTPQVHDLTLELHGLRAEQWIPLVVARDELAIDGALGGKLTANSDHSGKRIPTVTGVVTLTDGQVQLGFVRSPLIVNTGSLTLDGKGLFFDLPNALLEGHFINYKVTLADFDHPALQIDAFATNFDFEVLRFIRLPWSPKTPVHFFPLPVEGHIAAKRANFDKLQMTAVSTDFTRAHDHWQVTNFKATTLGGNVTLNLSGTFSRRMDQRSRRRRWHRHALSFRPDG